MDSRTKAAIALSVLSTLGQTALQLSDYHSGPLAGTLLVAMIAPAVYAAWHGTNVVRETRGKASLKLEPIHIIILGLLIALAGVVWQWQGGSANALPNSGVAQKSEPSGPIYATKMSAGLSNVPSEPVVIVGRAAVNSPSLRFFVRWATNGTKDLSEPVLLQELPDVMEGASFSIPVLFSEDNKLYWGEPSNKRSLEQSWMGRDGPSFFEIIIRNSNSSDPQISKFTFMYIDQTKQIIFPRDTDLKNMQSWTAQ